MRRALRGLVSTFLLPSTFYLLTTTPAASDVTDRIIRTVPLPAGTPLTLQVTVGDVRVTAWERAEVAIEIMRRAPSVERLARIPAQIDAATAGVTIRAVQAGDGRDRDLRTDMTLRVPASVHLHEIAVFEGRIALTGITGSCTARIERGDIIGTNVSGAIRLETAIGNIELQRALLVSDGVIRLRTFNGNVTVGLATKPTHARVLALSMGGTITSDLPLNRQERWGPRWGEATIGNGEPVLSIDVVNGNITIKTGS